MLIVSSQHVSPELAYLQSLSEAELRELVLMPSFLVWLSGCSSHSWTAGVGKDIVFSQQDPMARLRRYAVCDARPVNRVCLNF